VIALYYAQEIGDGSPKNDFRSALTDHVVEEPKSGTRMLPLVRGREFWWVEGPQAMHETIAKDARCLALTPIFASGAERDAWLQGGKASFDATALTRLRSSGLTNQDVQRASRCLDLLKELMWKLGVSR
jgi:hypothetical protein